MNKTSEAGAAYFGKYRGKMIDSVDPLFQGRILAETPAIREPC